MTATQAATSQTIEAFTFGEPVPVLSQREVFDYLEAMHNGRWYEPPLSLNGLSRVYRAGVHHASAIQLKRNILRSCFIPHPKLSLAAFTGLALDYLIFGNGYLQAVQNRLGGVLRYDHLRAKYTRRALDLDTYWWIAQPGQEQALPRAGGPCDGERHQPGDLRHPRLCRRAQLHPAQRVGHPVSPQVLRERPHAGFIMHITDAVQNEGDIAALREALRQSPATSATSCSTPRTAARTG